MTTHDGAGREVLPAEEDEHAVAIVGLFGRFPGAPDPEAFWRNLEAGVESVTRFGEDELRAAGVPPDLLDDPDWVPVRGVLDHAECFDAPFFGMSPREAQRTDPQHRVFLEACWAALEDAALDPARVDGPVGVFAGCSANTYLTHNLLRDPALVEALGGLEALVGADADHLATRASYKLGLTGPSLTVQTACSTSLVALHLACQSLVDGECDAALAGAASIHVPMQSGHRYQPGGILSPDGHTRTFDADAAGAVGGDGVAVVVLKRLGDALADGDPVRAVIRGTAINNDGGRKVGYTAPSVDGQAEAIAMAQAVAGVPPDTIGYVEAHGTATRLGDPVEVAALTRAFGQGTERTGDCALGSVKTNVGHLNAAAGMAGLAKAVLALEHGAIPASLHYREPNPEIDLDSSPFYVAAETRPWPRSGGPRRAGVSSFGAGGTNAHVILEEAPFAASGLRANRSTDEGVLRVFPLSARSEEALEGAATRLADHLEAHPELRLADVAHTLREGRRAFPLRRAVVAANREEAVTALRGHDPDARADGRAPEDRRRPVAFLFPGQGFQRPGMGRGLYEADPVFRREVDRCAEILLPMQGDDVRDLLFPAPEQADEAAARLDDQLLAGPALFALCWALAQRWIEAGVTPDALLGQSTGEYMAAAVAGVLSLEDALDLFVTRARLMDRLPRGAMLHVPMAPDELEPRLPERAWLALVNGPRACVVTGTPAAVGALADDLEAEEVPCRRVRVSVPAHSPLLEPIADDLAAAARRVRLRAPRIPVLSGATGGWLTPEEATDPDYWVRHLLRPVRLADAFETLAAEGAFALAEIGPARSMSALASYNLPDAPVVAGVAPEDHPASAEPRAAARFALRARAALWAAGSAPPPAPEEDDGRRVHLPTYAFDRRRYWLEPRGGAAASLAPRLAEVPGIEAEAGAVPRRRRHPRPDLATEHVAPRTRAEAELSAIVEDLLEVEGIGVHDEFFALGGTSLVTLELIRAVRDRLGVDLPPAAAFQGLTVARMARFLDEGAPEPAGGPDEPPSCLVPIRSEGSRPPLFFVHPAAGIVFPYFELARLLGPDQPFYGLQAHGIDGEAPPDRTVDEMAARYLDAVRRIQPSGPWFIGGYSFGCYIAYEMASRLQSEGEEVGLLALVDEGAPIDGHRPTKREVMRLWLGPAGRTFLRHLQDYLYLRSRGGDGGPPGLPGLGAWKAFLERSAMAALIPEEARDVALDQPAMRPLARLFALHLRETFRYRAAPSPLRAVLFKSDWSVDRPWWERRDRDEALGWGRLARGGVEIRRIPGDHLAVLRQPHVGALAEQLGEALDRALRSPDTAPGPPAHEADAGRS
ncbi:MAG: type I polyketide synthase [Myxococcota bacterium]